MKPVAVIQARVGSSRLPGKVLAPIGGAPVLARVVERCRLSRALGGVAIVTSECPGDDAVVDIADSLDVEVYRGSETDVLDRYVRAIDAWGLETIVRVTADCPLLDPQIVDDVVAQHARSGADYVCFGGYPNGADAELATAAALRRAHAETGPGETYYREHVITYLLDHPDRFHLDIPEAPDALRRPTVRLSVDEPADLEVVRLVYASFAPRTVFGTADVIRLLDEHPEIARINAHVKQKTR